MTAASRSGIMGDATMTLYFAYGSNLNRAAMQRRCPGARIIDAGELA